MPKLPNVRLNGRTYGKNKHSFNNQNSDFNAEPTFGRTYGTGLALTFGPKALSVHHCKIRIPFPCKQLLDGQNFFPSLIHSVLQITLTKNSSHQREIKFDMLMSSCYVLSVIAFRELAQLFPRLKHPHFQTWHIKHQTFRHAFDPKLSHIWHRVAVLMVFWACL